MTLPPIFSTSARNFSATTSRNPFGSWHVSLRHMPQALPGVPAMLPLAMDAALVRFRRLLEQRWLAEQTVAAGNLAS